LALQWTSTEAVLRPQADGAMPVASYGFRNATGAAVTITQTVPSCDCITVELAAKTYAPGERGTLVVRFDPTGRSGIVMRTIAVSTDEPGEPPQVLTLTPHDLRWAAGEPPAAKTVDVLVNLPEGVELTAAWANHPDFKVELITVTARSHYCVKVTPPGRGKAGEGGAANCRCHVAAGAGGDLAEGVGRGAAGDGADVLRAGEMKALLSGKTPGQASDLTALVPGLDTHTVGYRYDALGRRSDLVYPDSAKVNKANDP